MVVNSLLGDLGLPYQLVNMRMGANGFESADGTVNHEQYLKIHHLGYVPCLLVDGVSITEMPAILTYIANLVPEKRLLGDNLIEQSLVLGWAAWLSGSLHGRGFGALFRPARFTDNESHYSEIKAKGLSYVNECYNLIDKRLKGRDFPVGNHETIIDFNLIVFYFWGLEQNIDMAQAYPEYDRLFVRMSKKAAVSKIDKFSRTALVFVADE
ncbi:glutathione S-transferase [Sporothrix brasiliensis 5110]|uniref:Glutathione S-transferase n=1 Tax=Sporothrix brasiliensis 5110 TaxID=1398154 RepID=A0A0C2J1M7_9PEZI|nr:glutathione S-transferase [Sporothrix brasiliensis 5110]KIH91002.1 glutathione S-transferase [Sporothrix brasiliensis 5110]